MLIIKRKKNILVLTENELKTFFLKKPIGQFKVTLDHTDLTEIEVTVTFLFLSSLYGIFCTNSLKFII